MARAREGPDAGFLPGHAYTRAEIHARLGGSRISCLPMREGVIVAACLTTVLNPRAPEVVLCGQGARTGPTSARFARQRTPVAMFLKRATNRWEYRGRFEVVEALTAGPRFAGFIAGSGRTLESVSFVVLLRRRG
jgi:hypothetical protein